MFNVPGVPTKTLQWHTPIAWRKDLDFWMNGKAIERGVKLWDAISVVHVEQRDRHCTVVLDRGKKKEEIRTRFIIGADGAGSLVRKRLFSELKVRYSVAIRECYQGALAIDTRYLHWFFPRSLPRPRFNINHKGDCFLVEGSGLKELRREIMETLRNYGFNPKNKLLWRDGCLLPLLHGALTSGSFTPAKGNILLVGDAAGLVFPLTFEGIGTALKSGMLAAKSIWEAVSRGRDASATYLVYLKPLIETIKDIQDLGKWIEDEAAKGALELAEALNAGYRKTLSMVQYSASN
jgi:flavin-dependent dehydrogenase